MSAPARPFTAAEPRPTDPEDLQAFVVALEALLSPEEVALVAWTGQRYPEPVQPDYDGPPAATTEERLAALSWAVDYFGGCCLWLGRRMRDPEGRLAPDMARRLRDGMAGVLADFVQDLVAAHPELLDVPGTGGSDG